MRRSHLIILVVLGIFAVVVVAIWPARSAAPSFSIVSIGRTAAPNGTAKFMVGVTNNTHSTMAILIGLDMTTSNGQTALTSEQQVVLGPRSGTQVGFDLTGETLPWPLAVYNQRRPCPVEKWAKILGARLKLYTFPGWEKVKGIGAPK